MKKMGDSSGIAPLIDWKLPYTGKTVEHSLGDAHPTIGVVSLDRCGGKDSLFERHWKVALVEGPRGLWCAWGLEDGEPKSWAPSVPLQNDHYPDFSLFQMKRACPETMPPETIRVPACQSHGTDSGVAAVVNAIWMTGRRRGHPGAIAYVEKRRADYEKAMKMQGTTTLSDSGTAVQTAAWISSAS